MASAALTVFISYSRHDLAFADRLVTSLEAAGFHVLIDRRDLPLLEEWQAELLGFIRSADTVIFVVSENAIRSPWCEWEVKQAQELGKRLAPVVVNRVDITEIPEAIRKINFVDFTNPSDFDARMGDLAQALSTNLGWVKDHTRLAALAQRWLDRDRESDLELRGKELKDAEKWLAAKPEVAPEPTAVQREFLVHSRRMQNRRRGIWATGLAASAAAVAALVFFTMQATRQTRMATQQARIETEQRQHQSQLREEAERLRRAETDRARKEREKRFENSARDLASNAKRATDDGDALTGTLLAIEAATMKQAENPQASAFEIMRSLYTAVYRNRETAWMNTDKNAVWALSPARPLVAIADDQSQVKIINAGTGEELASFKYEGGKVNKLAFDKKASTLLVTGHATARLFRLDSKQQVTPGGSTESMSRAVFCGDDETIATTPEFGSTAFALRNDKGLRHLKSAGENSISATIACNSDGSRLVIWGSLDGVVALIDTRKDIRLRTLGSDYGIKPPSFSPDGKRLLAVKEVGSGLILLDTETGKPLPALSPGEHLECWEFSPDGKLVVAGSENGTAFIWDAATGALVKTLKISNSAAVTSAILDNKGRRLLVGLSDNSARVLDRESGAMLTSLTGQSGPIVRAIFGINTDDDENETDVVSASSDGSIAIWDIANVTDPRQELLLKTSLPKLSSIELRYPALIATLGDTGFVSWNARPSWRDESSQLLAVSADGGTAVLYQRPAIRVIDVATGADYPNISLRKHTDSSSLRAALTKDGKRLVTVSNDRSIRVWDSASGLQLDKLESLPRNSSAIAYNATRDQFVIGFDDGSAGIWSIEPLRQVQSLGNHGRPVIAASFSNDGSRIITATDYVLSMTDTATGRVKTLPSEDGSFLSAAFDPGGSAFVTVEGMGLVRRWDVSSLRETSRVKTKGVSAMRISFDPTGKRIVYGGNLLDSESFDILVAQSQANLWTVTPFYTPDARANFTVNGRNLKARPFFPGSEDILNYARSAISRCLTPDQRAIYNLPAEPPVWCADKWPSNKSKLSVEALPVGDRH